MKMLNERQQFEDWVAHRYGDDELQLKLEDDDSGEYSDEYENHLVQGEWESWQASREYQIRYQLKYLCWSVTFNGEYPKLNISEDIPSGIYFRANVLGKGKTLCWDGEVNGVTEDGVKEFIQPTLDKLNSLYGVEVDEISIWEER